MSAIDAGSAEPPREAPEGRRSPGDHGSPMGFIDPPALEALLREAPPDAAEIRAILARSLAKEPLAPEQAARLLLAPSGDLAEEIFEAARQLKRDVYGKRIVLFAPLYVGSRCVNDCLYCGFRSSNTQALRRTLEGDELRTEVEALIARGHKRLVLVFGEHAAYSPGFIAETVRTVYGFRSGPGEIRRVNVNAAPLDVEGFRIVREAGIGTYQVFQESYHPQTYGAFHPVDTAKADFRWRLMAADRAMEAGIDDFGIGALFGLGDWRYEVLGLVAHARHLRSRWGVGPHTISFPRLQPASGVRLVRAKPVADLDFLRLIAVLRLSVPYTGLILTARERPEIRREALGFGVSQIDGGTRIGLGAYGREVAGACEEQVLDEEQFRIGDTRSLDEVVRELIETGHIPSFCTACYRLGRTGEHFMEYAVPGFIEQFCTPNALCTLEEYLADYASPETRALGSAMIRRTVEALPDAGLARQLSQRLESIRNEGARDLRF